MGSYLIFALPKNVTARVVSRDLMMVILILGMICHWMIMQVKNLVQF